MRTDLTLRLSAPVTLLALVAAAAFTAASDPSPDVRDMATDSVVFAGGCFWCMEHPFDELDGVISTTSGYAGGSEEHPTYKQVSSGDTGHREVVQVVYDPARVSYQQLIDRFWVNIDPTDEGGQFCDRGFQYTSAIYAEEGEDRAAAERSRQALMESGRLDAPVATEVVPAAKFWAAEDYHQNYEEQNPIRYKFYRFSCGRDGRLDDLWGDDAREGQPVPRA